MTSYPEKLNYLVGISETRVMRVQSNYEPLQEKVGGSLALGLARLGRGTTVPPGYN